MTVRAIVFDFDGVIIDSEVTNFEAWSEIYRRYGATLTAAEYVESMGDRHFNVYELLANRTTQPLPDEQTVRAAKRVRQAELLAATDMLPGVADWISAARGRGLRVGIASSSDQPWLDEHLDRIGLAASFDCVCCFDGLVPAKPAPDLYLRACEQLGVAPDAALAVEDSPSGLLAARRRRAAHRGGVPPPDTGHGAGRRHGHRLPRRSEPGRDPGPATPVAGAGSGRGRIRAGRRPEAPGR